MATTVSGSFSGTGVSAIIGAPIEGVGTFAITGTFVGKVQIEEATTPAGLSWRKIKGPYSVAHSSSFEAEIGQIFRVRCTSYTSGTISYSLVTPTSAAAPQNVVTGNLEVTGSGGITIGGRQAINVGPGAVFIGSSAGASQLPSANAWDVFIGTNAGQTYAGAGAEAVAIGSGAHRFLTTGFHTVAIGQMALMTETTGVLNVAVGCDAMRNVAGTSNGTAVGSDSGKYGCMFANVAVGAQALTGNSSSIIIGGTATAADTLQVTFTSDQITGSPLTITYSVTAGQTTTQMATGLTAAINANTTLSGLIGGPTGAAIGAYSAANVVALTWAGTDIVGPIQPVISVAVTGSATETMTLVAGPSGTSNIAIGYKALYGAGLSTGHDNIAIGGSVGQTITSGSSNVLVGPNTAFALTTGNQNVAIGSGALASGTTAGLNVCIGNLAGNAVTTSTLNVFIGGSAGLGHSGATGSNVCIGSSSGAGLTSGGANTLIGPSAAAASSGQVTSGSNNVSIGNQVAVASATANNQLCIGNFIYGTGLAGTGATISTAKIGLGIKAPAVELDVVGTINASVAYQTAGTQVIGARVTGYAAMTGTPNKAAVYDTATVTLAQLAGRMAQLQADLTTHGLIGA